MKIAIIILFVLLFIMAVLDSIATLVIWVINKIDKEETEDYDRRL